WLAEGRVLRGWALSEQGQTEEGITQMEQGLAFFRTTGTEIKRVGYLPVLAAAYGRLGRGEEGLSLLTEARALVTMAGMRVVEARLYVTKGEILRAGSGDYYEEAEVCFRQAIEITRQQQAKSLELRAVMSLSRLWQQQGKQHEAHRMLAGVYNWFTEGFDTKDLQEAKALLQELSDSR